MPLLELADFERDALETLTTFATIPCLSPGFDTDWVLNGHIDRAIELLSDWALARTFAEFDVEIHRLDGRTPVLTVTIAATAPGDGTAVLYGHLDKQPPLGNWSDGLGPYDPVRRDDRLYARGVGDDGYSTFSALLAVEAMEANEHSAQSLRRPHRSQ
jgi:acetylornithine deacetylase/succinyl-diaminopimelate desuccinylase-like protein